MHYTIIASLLAGATIARFDCTGCERENQQWGGGAAGESWSYTPGLADEDGQCTPSCVYDRNCKYTGNLKFTNNSGGSRDITDNQGNPVPGSPIASGAKWEGIVSIKAPCGATGNAAEQYQARAAGVLTSAYMFYCGGCFEIAR
jgi:hypothetical protein